ncbi:unnamed protein product, partial [Pylaiella littoralis]
QDAPFSPVRRGPIFTKETIGGDDANSMDTDEDDRVHPDPDADRFTPQGEDDDDDETMSEDEEEDEVREVLVHRAALLSCGTVSDGSNGRNCSRESGGSEGSSEGTAATAMLHTSIETLRERRDE